MFTKGRKFEQYDGKQKNQSYSNNFRSISCGFNYDLKYTKESVTEILNFERDMGKFQQQKSEFLQYHLQNDIQKIQDVQLAQQIEKEYLNAKINKNDSNNLNQINYSQNQNQNQDIQNTNQNNLQKFLQQQHVNQLKLETDTEKQSEFQNDQVQKKQAYQINQEKLMGKIIKGNSEKNEKIFDNNVDENDKNKNDLGQKSITIENNYDEQYLGIQKDILDSRKNQNNKNIQQEKQQLKQQVFEFNNYNQHLQFQNLNKSDNYLDIEQNQINQQNQLNSFNMRKSLDSRKFARLKSAEKNDSKKQFIAQKDKVFNKSSLDFKEIQSALNINQINVQSLEKNNYVNDLQMPEFVKNLKIASNQGSQQEDNMHAFLKKYSESQKIQEQNQSNNQNQKEKNQGVDLNFKSKKFINSQRKLKNKSQSNFYTQEEKSDKNQNNSKENKEKINKNEKIQLGHKNEMQSNLLGEIQSQEVNQNLIQQINSDKKQKNQKDEYKNLRANTVGIQQQQYLSTQEQKKQKYSVQGEKLGQNTNKNLNKSAIEFYNSEKLENKDQQEIQESQQEIQEKIYQELRNGFLSTFKQKSQQKLQNKSQILNQNLNQNENKDQKQKQKKESKQKTLEKQFREFGKDILQIKGQNKIGIIRPQSHSLNRKQNLVDGKHKKSLKNTYTLQNYQTQNQNGYLYENQNQIEQLIDFQSLLQNMDFNNFAENHLNQQNKNQQQQGDHEEIFYHITLDSNLNNSKIYNLMGEQKNKNKNQSLLNEKGQKSRNQFRNQKQRKTEINQSISENLIQFDQFNQIQLQQQLLNKEQTQNKSPLNKKLLGQINSLTQQNLQLQQEFDNYQKTYVEDNFGYLYKRADLQQRKIEKMNRSCLGSFYKKNVTFQKQQSKNLDFDLQLLSKTEGLENQNQKILENSLENGKKNISNVKQNQESKKSAFHTLKTQDYQQIQDNGIDNDIDQYLQLDKNKDKGVFEESIYKMKNKIVSEGFLEDQLKKQEIFINSQKQMLREEIQRKKLIEKYEKNKISKEQQNMNLDTEDSDKSLKLEKQELLENDKNEQQSVQQQEFIDQQLQLQKNQNEDENNCYDDENNYQNELNIYDQQFQNQIQQQKQQQGLQKIENKEYMKKKYKVSELYPSFLPKKGINQNMTLVYQQNQNEF
ncbi:hypothetical protein PPERSA_02606 [Pseudocohnilembus persalinus]|uniref:Uncharacterized protein n=1 Tax=Pseudocohnilembus persalinus TaxID=266149 RepID=A0A0V0R5G1_PSEPJ|nr:hypothetical protein PPERSA_02606 [Pseudocohnilembus persalinus]|eukprot:KRX09734.1 hypothetical protein PPERSA_02606 [Pseudocohnilembus persalinus]